MLVNGRNKTVGILTYSRSINYGACLQTYALQAYLKECGFSVEEIDYRAQGHSNHLGLFQRIRSFVWQKTLRVLLKDRKRENKTELFQTKRIQYTEQVFRNFEDLKKCHSYDYVVVGSDQVWNPKMIGKDSSWFLDFADKSKKIAYGGSFGISKLPNEFQQFYVRNLRNINMISVREESGAEIVEELIKTKPLVVVDPVFLLERLQWENILIKPSVEKYVLCYYMPGFPKAEAQIARLARVYADRYKLKVLNVGKRETAKIQLGQDNQFGIGPAEFVGLVKNAEAIITNSFHGTAFSLIFEKKFLSVAGHQSGCMDLSSRIIDFLSRLDMQEWVVSPLQQKIVEPRCIPKNSREILQQEIKKSKQFLFDALEVKDDEYM